MTDNEPMNEISPPGLKPLCGLLAGLTLMGLAGCAAVGPDYTPPAAKAPNAWHTALQNGLSAGPIDPVSIASWWTRFDDPVLSELITGAVTNNLDLAEARARVREARAGRGISQAALFPALDATASATKSRSSENSGSGRESELYAVGFDAGWELDVFGGVRRSIEASDADLAAITEDLYDVLVSLVAETALNYLEARTFQERLRVAEANIKTQEETYRLTRSRFEAGLSDELPVQQALYNLESSRSELPTLRTGLEAAQNRLAVLLGMQPGAVHDALSEAKPIPVPPVSVAVGVPAEALRRRPDVRRAERRLAAQTARIGVAVADLYPKFRLSGSIGLESISTGDVLNTDSRTWRIGPGISWNVFDAGAIRRNIAVNSALQEQALIQHESTLLAALEEVENALTAYAEEQHRRRSLIAATEAAQLATALSRDRYMAGLVDFSNVLINERAVLSFQDNLALSNRTVTANLVRLYKALGGGWTPLDEGSDVASSLSGETP
ncbi:MAG: TolC family protein [Desulfobacterales bacterium]|nr:TolC family protein [Desulfobacterales bacterium]